MVDFGVRIADPPGCAVLVDVVADYLIAKGDKPNGEPLTQLGLHKLVYFCQGWHLALTDETLFPEDILAYELGPVVKELRRRFRFFGAAPLVASAITDADRILSAGAKRVIDAVWQRYGAMPTSRLVDLTHEQGGPWSRAWEAAAEEDRDAPVIPVASIRDHFKELLADGLTPMTPPPRDLRAVFEGARTVG